MVALRITLLLGLAGDSADRHNHRTDQPTTSLKGRGEAALIDLNVDRGAGQRR